MADDISVLPPHLTLEGLTKEQVTDFYDWVFNYQGGMEKKFEEKFKPMILASVDTGHENGLKAAILLANHHADSGGLIRKNVLVDSLLDAIATVKDMKND